MLKLTQAHTHARNALLETRRSNPVAASEEHDLAAGEFANAAQSTADAEARKSHHVLLSYADNPPRLVVSFNS